MESLREPKAGLAEQAGHLGRMAPFKQVRPMADMVVMEHPVIKALMVPPVTRVVCLAVRRNSGSTREGCMAALVAEAGSKELTDWQGAREAEEVPVAQAASV